MTFEKGSTRAEKNPLWTGFTETVKAIFNDTSSTKYYSHKVLDFFCWQYNAPHCMISSAHHVKIGTVLFFLS